MGGWPKCRGFDLPHMTEVDDSKVGDDYHRNSRKIDHYHNGSNQSMVVVKLTATIVSFVDIDENLELATTILHIVGKPFG